MSLRCWGRKNRPSSYMWFEVILLATLFLMVAVFAVLPVGETHGGVQSEFLASTTITCTVTPGSPLSVIISAPDEVEVREPFFVEVTVVNKGNVAMKNGTVVVYIIDNDGDIIDYEGIRVSPPSRKWRLLSAGEEEFKFNVQAQAAGTFLLAAYAKAELDSGAPVDAWSDAVEVEVVERERPKVRVEPDDRKPGEIDIGQDDSGGPGSGEPGDASGQDDVGGAGDVGGRDEIGGVGDVGGRGRDDTGDPVDTESDDTKPDDTGSTGDTSPSDTGDILPDPDKGTETPGDAPGNREQQEHLPNLPESPAEKPLYWP